MRRSLKVFVAALVLSAANAQAQEAPKPHNRAEAVKVIADLRKIVTARGIERTQKVRIGGIDQWVSIRSHDARNPVLLVLHGGPGWVSMPASWWSAHGWDEYFTVIQWDQRGAGKTYVENDPAKVAPTMTVERMHADAEEMVAWARSEFGKKKIFVLGHSWGSLLGLTLAQKRPEWLHAYIGAAQGIDAAESERRGWRWTLDKAKVAGNAEAIRDLESIAPYAQGRALIPVKDIMLQRKWLNFFGGAVHNRKDAYAEAGAVKLSPEYTDEDLRQVWKAQDFSVGKLLPAVLSADYRHVKRIDTPLILFLGRHDTNLSATVAAEWFETVKAPSKKLIWFENSAHEMMSEEPGRTLVSLVRYARPIAERAGDVAP